MPLRFSARKPLAVLVAILALALAAAAGAGAAPSAAAARTAAASAPGIRVSGARLLTASGAPLHVAGVNRSGTEYACAQGWGIFDGPSDAASVAAIAAWGVNAVRVPLNEDCWLGINGVASAYAGARYRSAIRGYVEALRAHGLDAILDLHWGAPAGQLALGQEQAPDADHAPAFWSSVAAYFRGQRGIAFDLFNEPHDISWSCWRNGCLTPGGWRAAGMQQLIDAVRRAGARQAVIAEGLGWGGDLSGWLAHEPRDPSRQLVAGWHVYNFSYCHTIACWNQTVAAVARRVPVLATEVGEDDCAGRFLHALLPWADSHRIGYLAWAWDTAGCGSGPSLISSYSGIPTAYGAAYRAHVASARRRRGLRSKRRGQMRAPLRLHFDQSRLSAIAKRTPALAVQRPARGCRAAGRAAAASHSRAGSPIIEKWPWPSWMRRLAPGIAAAKRRPCSSGTVASASPW
jgi:endoglucanase